MRSLPPTASALLVVASVLAAALAAAPALAASPVHAPPANPPGQQGQILLQVVPATASVELDDSPVTLNAQGFANLTLPVGQYPLVVSESGYETYSGSVTISSQPLSVHVHLTTSPAGGSPGLSTDEVLAIAGVLAVVGGVAAFLLVRRMGRPRAPMPPKMPSAEPVQVVEEKPDPEPHVPQG